MTQGGGRWTTPSIDGVVRRRAFVRSKPWPDSRRKDTPSETRRVAAWAGVLPIRISRDPLDARAAVAILCVERASGVAAPVLGAGRKTDRANLVAKQSGNIR